MKLYILTHGSVRRERATADEIADFVAGRNASWEQLATVRLDEDGDITATPLTDAEMRELGARQEAMQAATLRECLDLALRLHRLGGGVSGFQFSSPVLVWPERAPWDAVKVGDVLVAIDALVQAFASFAVERDRSAA